MSVQVVAAKMAEVELKDVLPSKDAPAGSPVTPTSEGKSLARNEAGSSAASSPGAESSAKAGESSLGLLTPNPVKMPQGSAMKRTDPQQNGGEAFVNRDGTVAEAPRMKKVGNGTRVSVAAVPSTSADHHVAPLGSLPLCHHANRLAGPSLLQMLHFIPAFGATNAPEDKIAKKHVLLFKSRADIVTCFDVKLAFLKIPFQLFPEVLRTGPSR